MARNRAAKAAAEMATAVANAVAAGVDAEETDEEAAAVAQDLGPLFKLDADDQQRHDRTRVYRLEPVNEGMLDSVSPDCGEEEIRDRWGGGKFMVQAIDAKGEIITKRTIKIAGDPVFDNDIAQRQFDRWAAQRYGGKNGAPAPATDGVNDQAAEERHRRTLERIRLEIEAKENAEERRRQREREEREAEYRRLSDERKAERERDEATRRAEREEREAREDRRWREEREARDRERQERMAVDEARWKAEREERERDREERRLVMEGRQDPTQMLVTGMKLAMDMGGGGEPADPMTAFINRAPELFAGAKDLISTGNAAPRPNPTTGKRPAKGAEEPLIIEGLLKQKILATAAHASKKYGNNTTAVIEEAIVKALDNVRGTVPKASKAPAAQKASSAETPAVPGRPKTSGKAPGRRR